MAGNTYPRGTVEYVSADLTEATGRDITGDTVELAIHHGEPDTWLACEWVGGGVRTVEPVSFDAVNYPGSSYSVSVRLHDNPETPIVRVGTLSIG